MLEEGEPKEIISMEESEDKEEEIEGFLCHHCNNLTIPA
jgi:hypothetical protein